MKILGIDYGRKRIGLALCGPLKVACPAGVILHSTREKDLVALSKTIEEHDVATIIVGLPKNMDDSIGEMAEEAENFANTLRDCLQLEVILWDERLTTWQAERLMLDAGISRAKRKSHRDAIAACLILQSYVDSNRVFENL